MKLIKANHDRRIEIPGLPAPVRRPVDIDQSQTGFTNLRTLRIYQFEAGSVIEGHAEEDEVFIVVLAGSIELTMNSADLHGSPSVLTAATESASSGCAAYLPPHAAYRLVPQVDADLAYVRATPVGVRPPRVFNRISPVSSGGITVFFEDSNYAEKLRLRLLQIDALEHEVAFLSILESESMCEALVHVRNASTGNGPKMSGTGFAPGVIDSWDTIAISPGENSNLHLGPESNMLVLIALAV